MNALINKIEFQGVVSNCAKEKIWVVPSTPCKEQQDCGIGCGSCGGKKPRSEIMIQTAVSDRLKPGTEVTVTTFALNEAIGALIVFGIPLLSALSVFAVWYAVDPPTAESGCALLTAGSAFVCGFLIVRIIDRLFRHRFPATVIPGIAGAVASSPAKWTDANA